MKDDKDLRKEMEFGDMFGVREVDYYCSPPDVDMIEHWDVAIRETAFEKRVPLEGIPNYGLQRIVSSGDHIRVDVKGHPRGKQADRFRWVEIQNVRGDHGWLYGFSDYIAFEHFESWILCATRRLAKLVKENRLGPVTSMEWAKNPQPYQIHTRKDKKDIVTQVPLRDLCHIGIILPKKP